MLDFKMAKETNLAEFLGVSKLCDCGEFHHLDTGEVFLHNGDIKKLAYLVTKACAFGKIGIITGNSIQSICDDAIQFLPKDRERSFIILPKDFTLEEKNIEKINTFDNDVKVIISIGGGKVTNTAKIIAKKMGVKLVSVVTSLTCDSILMSKVNVVDGWKIKCVSATSPISLIIDEKYIENAPKELTASSVGVIGRNMLAAFDSLLNNKFSIKNYCPYLIDMIVDATKKCLEGAILVGEKKDDGYSLLIEGFVRVAIAKELINVPLVSVVDNVIFAHNLQKTQEGLKHNLFGVDAINVFVQLAKIYKLFYSTKVVGNIKLPDADKCAELLISKLGIPTHEAYKMTGNMISVQSYSTINKVIQNNKEYFKSGVDKINNNVDIIVNTYLNILEKETADKEDYRYGMYLSTEMCNDFSTLRCMKYLGLLESL